MREHAAQLSAEADALEDEEDRLAEEEERQQLAVEQAQWGTPTEECQQVAMEQAQWGEPTGQGSAAVQARSVALLRKRPASKPDRLVAVRTCARWLVRTASLALTAAAVWTVPILKPQWGPSARAYDLACLLPAEAAQLVCSGDAGCIQAGAAVVEGNAVLRSGLCPKMLLGEQAAKLGNLSWLKPVGETVAAKAVMSGYDRAVWIQLLCLVAFYASVLNLACLGRRGTGFIGTVLAAAGGLILAEGGHVPMDAALLIIGLSMLAVAAR